MAAKDAPAKAYRAGQEAMQAGDYRSAQTSFLWASTLEPDNPIHLHAAAGAAIRMGAWREAEGLYRKAVTLAEASAEAGQSRVALVACSLVALYEDQGRVDEARQLSERVVGTLDRDEAVHANLPTLERLATLFQMAHRAGEGEALLRDAVTWREKVFGSGHEKVASCRDLLSRYLRPATPQEQTAVA